MKSKWFRLLALVPMVVILIGVNIYGDPAHIFHQDGGEIAESILEGNQVYCLNDDERYVKAAIAEQMPDHVECLALGGSQILCVNRDLVGTDSFYNLWVSGGGLYDILAQFGMMEYYGKTYDRVIIAYTYSCDLYYFESGESGTQYETYMDYTEYMLDILNNEDAELKSGIKWSSLKTMIEQAFSVTYFQSSLDAIISSGGIIVRWGIVDDDFDGSLSYYDVDASRIYALEAEEKTPEDVADHAQALNIDSLFGYNTHMSGESQQIISSLIEYLTEKDVEVDLFLAPFAPSLWERLEKDPANEVLLSEMTAFAQELQDRYGVGLIGGYDPSITGITDADYYDALHIRRNSLEKYFDFS